MNYQKIYNNIISNAKSKNRQKLNKENINYIYYEKHHIIPKCLNGSNDKKNLVLLTAKEHYVCHKLLTYIYPNNRKIACAFHYMTFNKKNKTNKSSRDYAYAVELYRLILISKETGKKISDALTGIVPWNKNKNLTIEHCKHLSDALKEKPKSEETIQKMKNHVRSEEHKQNLKKPKTEEHKRKLSIGKLGDLNPAKRPEVREQIGNTLRGRKDSEETKQNKSKSKLGKKQSEEHIKNRFKSLRGKKQKIVICPHCFSQGGASLMGRYHFNNCKLKVA